MVAGLLGAALMGWLVSGLGPLGSARAIAPEGFDVPVDVALALLGSLAVVLLLAVLCVAAAASGPSRQRPARPSVVRGLLDRLDPARAAGVRAAARGPGAGAVLAGSTAAVAVVLASGVFSANVNALLGSPERYGWPYDAAVLVGFGYGGADLDTIDRELDQPSVEGWGAASLGSVTIDGEPVPGIADRRGFGDLGLQVTDGRLPQADDEIALGRTTASELGIEVGQEVTLSGYFGNRGATVSDADCAPRRSAFSSLGLDRRAGRGGAPGPGGGGRRRSRPRWRPRCPDRCCGGPDPRPLVPG